MTIRLISCLRFAMQLLIGECVYTVGWKRKPGRFRLPLAITGFFGASTLMYYAFVQIPGTSPITSILYYTSIFVLSMVAMHCAFDADGYIIIFSGCCSYATQHIAFALTTVITHLLGISLTGLADFLLIRLLPYVAVAALLYFLVPRHYAGRIMLDKWDIQMLPLFITVVLTVTVISALVDNQHIRDNALLLRQVFCKLYAVISSALTIFLAYHIAHQNKTLHEQKMLESMLRQMAEKQRLSQETINIINIKCHDLKYRLTKIGHMESTDEQREYIAEVQNALDIYDNIFQTGSSALDLILREKHLLCSEYDIKLSTMVDGAALSAMSSTDIYALFGNLLDNAIESVRKEPIEEKRIISMQITRKGRETHVHLENSCDAALQFENGLPLTTKKDKAFHGFGVKSIQYIVKKYKGEVLMRVVHGKFTTDIVFCNAD